MEETKYSSVEDARKYTTCRTPGLLRVGCVALAEGGAEVGGH